jgi:hypothetical protein
MKNLIQRNVYVTLLLATAASFSGCPIQPDMGDWILAVNEDGTPLWGLTLKADGTVESFDYGGTDALEGTITWVSDGFNLVIEQNSLTVHHVFDAVLQSPTYAEGDFKILEAEAVIGTCYLTKTPLTFAAN